MDPYKLLQIFTSIASAFSATFAVYSIITSTKEKKLNIQIDNINHFSVEDFLVFKLTISNNSSLPISITSIDFAQGNDTYKFSLESICYNSIMLFEGDRLINRCLGKTSDFPIYIPSYGSASCCVAVNYQDIEVDLHAIVTLLIHTNRDKKSQSKSLQLHL